MALKCIFNRVADFFGYVVDVLFVLQFVGEFLVLVFFVVGVLIPSCDLRHGIIFFCVLFWCVSEVCIGVFGIANWVAMSVVESEECWLSVSLSELIDAVNELLGYR